MLALPTAIADSLFAVSRTQRSPPSHLLVRVSIFHDGSSSGGPPWRDLPFAVAAQLVGRDLRGGTELQQSFLDVSNVVFHAESQQLQEQEQLFDFLKSMLFGSSVSSFASSSLSSLPSPVSHLLSPALLQSFVDLPVAVDCIGYQQQQPQSQTKLLLEQCVIVKAEKPDHSHSSNVFRLQDQQQQSLFLVRLRFAVPMFCIQQSSSTSATTSAALSTITLRRRTKAAHKVDLGKALLAEHLLNRMCVSSGGQNSCFAVKLFDEEAEEEQDRNESFEWFEVMQSSAPVGFVGPETRVVVNSAAVAAHRQQKSATTVTHDKFSGNDFCDYNSALSNMKSLLQVRAGSEASSVLFPRGVLISAPSGNGASRFVQELATAIATKSSTRQRFFQLSSASDSERIASEIVDEMKALVSQQQQEHPQERPWLILDPATRFFEVDDDAGGDEEADIEFRTPAARFLSMYCNEIAACSSSSWTRVLLVVTMPEDKLHLVPDAFRRHFVAASTVTLALPTESQREVLLRHFLADQQQMAMSADLTTIRNIAQRSIGFCVADLKLLCEHATSTAIDSVVRQLESLPLPRPRIQNSNSSSSQQKKHVVQLEKTQRISWDDIAGLHSVKQAIHRAIIWPIQNRDKARRFGIDRLGGVMLAGPPGCAKTTIARAICSEGNFAAFFHLDCASVLSAFVGEAERCIRSVFAQARAQSPSVIFFDEIESFGVKRKGGGDGGNGSSSDIGVRLLATLLTEMDGINSEQQKQDYNGGDEDDDSNFGVCVIGATNLLHLVDDALLRPGRFDLVLQVPLPDLDDREKIFAHCLKKSNRNNNNKSGESDNCGSISITADTAKLAALSQGKSGADITGAWRDGVVAAVTARGMRDSMLLLLGAEEEEGEARRGGELMATLDVTEHVARCVLN